jgi:hypothetical protein
VPVIRRDEAAVKCGDFRELAVHFLRIGTGDDLLLVLVIVPLFVLVFVLVFLLLFLVNEVELPPTPSPWRVGRLRDLLLGQLFGR